MVTSKATGPWKHRNVEARPDELFFIQLSAGLRLAQIAAHLVQLVIPRLPVRQ